MDAGVWQFIIVVLAALFVFGIPALIIHFEKSEKKIGRARFSLWIFPLLALAILTEIAGLLARSAGVDAEPIINAPLAIVGLLIIFPFYRRVVRRARDAGMGKAIAYWSIVPIFGWLLYLYLLFKSPKATEVDQL